MRRRGIDKKQIKHKNEAHESPQDDEFHRIRPYKPSENSIEGREGIEGSLNEIFSRLKISYPR